MPLGMNKSVLNYVKYDFIREGGIEMELKERGEYNVEIEPPQVGGATVCTVPANAENPECDGQSGNGPSLCANNRVKNKLVRATYVLLFVLYLVYLGFAVSYDAENSVFVCIFGVILFLVLAFKIFHLHRTKPCSKIWNSVSKSTVTSCLAKEKVRLVIRWTATALLGIGVAVFLIVDIISDTEKLTPLGGLALFLVLLWITSTSPLKVRWIPVISGLLVQFGMGLLILRWPPGYAACKFLGDSVTTFLAYTNAGSKVVFGDPGYTLHVVAFQILPVVIFFSSVVSVLYYLGILQSVIRVIALILEFLMQTSPIESFATAAHIFIGQVESSVALKPFLNSLTDSELNAVMTSGYATVAGTVIAAYIEFGVPAEHVITASFMSAPAALAVAKLNYPEMEVLKAQDEPISLDVGKETNITEAASAGAASAAKLIAYVLVNLIAFLAILAFLDATVLYFAGRVGYSEVTFEFLCSYIFMPLAVVMGVPWNESRTVGKLIGKKILANEFLAYADLGAYVKDNLLQPRTIVISTYILCGFGSFAAMGINLGALSAAEPRKRPAFAKLLFRSLIQGNVACFMTACIAGILYQDKQSLTSSQNFTISNFTLNDTTSPLPQVLNVTL